jgi:hypothetical protein
MISAEDILRAWNVEPGDDVVITSFEDLHQIVHEAMQAAIDNAREYYEGGLDEGVRCPLCDRFDKRYSATIGSHMCKWLTTLVRLAPEYDGGWVHVNEIERNLIGRNERTTLGSSGFAKLRFWGMIERMPNEDDPSKKHKGIWRPLQAGIDFANRQLSVQKKVWLLHDEFQHFDGEQVFIDDVDEDYFHYQRMMADRPSDLVR